MPYSRLSKYNNQVYGLTTTCLDQALITTAPRIDRSAIKRNPPQNLRQCSDHPGMSRGHIIQPTSLEKWALEQIDLWQPGRADVRYRHVWFYLNKPANTQSYSSPSNRTLRCKRHYVVNLSTNFLQNTIKDGGPLAIAYKPRLFGNHQLDAMIKKNYRQILASLVKHKNRSNSAQMLIPGRIFPLLDRALY